MSGNGVAGGTMSVSRCSGLRRSMETLSVRVPRSTSKCLMQWSMKGP